MSRRMSGITILADDFTGAAEVAAEISGWWRSRLLSGATAKKPLVPQLGEAICFNTDTRHESEASAAGKLRSLLAGLGEDAWVYKKCDSTLRGNIAAEIETLNDRFPNRQIVYAGAAPRVGRTVRNGCVFVNGMILTDTPFASDPRFAVSTASIPAVLRITGLEVRVWKPGQTWPEDAKIVVADGENEKDLAALVTVLAGKRPLLAGAGAFANKLPALVGISRGGRKPKCIETAPPKLIVNGSLHPVSLAQMRRAAHFLNRETIQLKPQSLFGSQARLAQNQIIASALARLREGSPALLSSAISPGDAEACLRTANANGICGDAVFQSITDTLAAVTERLLRDTQISCFVTIGGELCSSLWTHLDLKEASVVGKWQGILPLLQIHSTKVSPSTWMTKPGGYGGEDALKQLLQGR